MSSRSLVFICLLSLLLLSGADANTFSDDLNFLRAHTDVIVLGEDSDTARVAVAPAWQGRVMTSTTGGDGEPSFGWINRALIAAGKLQPQINAFGGEDRFWLGPEGSQYSIYFAPGSTFDGANWRVPAPLDTLPFKTIGKSKDRAMFRAEFSLTNYSGTLFQVAVDREIRVFDNRDSWEHLQIRPAPHVSLVAYESKNTLINAGKAPWKKASGLLSIWILGMLNATSAATVVVPIKPGADADLGVKVSVYEAYGDQPPDRLKASENAVFFRGDAKFRGKIGISPRRSLGKIGSYDASKGVLTLVQFSQPPDASDYVNSLWGRQQRPYAGDAINSYNDGPPAPGAKSFGPFYELESSSPAAALKPGERLTHTHRTFHLTGPADELDAVARAVLGVSLAQIEAALPSSTTQDAVTTQLPSLQQKAVLVTGASSGIGRKITEHLAADGYIVYAGGRTEAELQSLDAIKNVKAVRLDVTDEQDIAAAVDTVTRSGRGLYALINNAGVLTTGSVVETSRKEFDLVMDVNVRGPYRLTQAFAPLIIAQKGRIVTIGSTSGIVAWPNGSVYTMSKHAMEAFTDSLAEEMKPLGVHVSIIDPGAYKSAIYNTAAQRGGFDPKTAESLTPKLKEPDDVAEAAVLALSEPTPKRRYLVTATEAEAAGTIKSHLVRLIQLNEDQRYTFDRDALIGMLDEALARSRPWRQ